MDHPAVDLQNLRVNRGGRTVLDGVDLPVEAGRVVALVGPSGSGKSTLLRCINRLLEPPAGTVRIAGQDVTSLDVLDLRRRVGMVFQQPVALAGSVAQNIAYGPGLGGRSLATDRIHELLAAAALPAAMAGRPADSLSGGEAQRLALARSLANDPSVLLLDEPTSALDPAARRTVGETVARAVRDCGVTVLWVTHDLDEAAAWADELVLLVAGKVAARGVPAQLLEDAGGPVARFSRGELAGEDAHA